MFGLLKRIKTICSASVNDALDKVEAPGKMLRQAVREMEDSIEKTQKATSLVMADKTMLEREMVRHEKQISHWAQQAETAVKGGNDELAKKAIARKQEHEKILDSLKQQHIQTAESIEVLTKQLKGMKKKYEEAKRKLNSFAARQRAADIRKRACIASNKYSNTGEAFARFERMKEKVEQAEAQADALQTINQAGIIESNLIEVDKVDDFDNSAVEAELAKLKASLA